MPEETRLSWQSARVEDATLTVDLEGEISKEWKRSFETTVRLLAGGEWGEVKVKKHAVRVSDVVPGEEDKVRFFLESVVSQANASVEPDEAEDESSDDAGEQEQPSGPDAEMTERFRAFSPDDGDDGEDEG